MSTLTTWEIVYFSCLRDLSTKLRIASMSNDEVFARMKIGRKPVGGRNAVVGVGGEEEEQNTSSR